MIIWIASYPRSGNTFLRVILNRIFQLKTHSIYDDAHDIAADDETAEMVGHAPLPDGFELQAARASDELYLIKTHELPPNHTDRAIYLIRDGREAVLSYANYRQTYHDPAISVAEGLNEITFGLDLFGSWGAHVRAWAPNEP